MTNVKHQPAEHERAEPPRARGPIFAWICAVVVLGASCDAHSPSERSQTEASTSRPTPVADRSRPIRGPEFPETFRGDDLRVPTSTSIVPRESGDRTATVVSTANEIRLGSESLVEIPVDASKKRGGESGLEIIPLLEELRARPGAGGDATGRGPELELVVDRGTRYRLLTEIMYTGGQAGFGAYDLVVTGTERNRAYEINLARPMYPGEPCCQSTQYLGHLNHHRDLPSCPAEDSGAGQKSDSRSGASKWGCGGTWGRVLGHENSRKRLFLTVALDASGIRVGAKGEILPPRDGCPEEGPTICLRDDSVDLKDKLQRARQLRREGGRDARDEASELLRRIQSAYDWRRLYETLVELKAKRPNETVFHVSANPNIPVQLIVRAIDVSRFVLPRRTYESSDAFRKALRNGRRFMRPAGNAMIPQVLFSDPILAIAK